LSKGNGTFASGVSYNLGITPAASPSVVFGDFNKDGKADIALSVELDNGQEEVAVFLGNGAGSFQPTPKVSAGILFAGTPVVGDFNNDGELDLAIQ
jgi:uncharacterized protein involved in tellurium resistance